jgi:hypothetical protein
MICITILDSILLFSAIDLLWRAMLGSFPMRRANSTIENLVDLALREHGHPPREQTEDRPRARGRGGGPVRGPWAYKGATSRHAEETGRRLSALLTDTLRLVRSGRSPDWLKSKNPGSAAVQRELTEDWKGR